MGNQIHDITINPSQDLNRPPNSEGNDGVFLRKHSQSTTLFQAQLKSNRRAKCVRREPCVRTFVSKNLDQIHHAILHSGFGRRLGMLRQVDSNVERIVECICVGTVYFNRNQIRTMMSVDGCADVRPRRLAGTCSKAAARNDRPRCVTETSIAIDITAAGGDAILLPLDT